MRCKALSNPTGLLRISEHLISFSRGKLDCQTRKHFGTKVVFTFSYLILDVSVDTDF